MPGGRGELVVMIRLGGAVPMINCNVLVEVWGVGRVSSVTVNVWFRLLVPVGTPLINPVDVISVNPVGKSGELPVSPHVWSPVPPVAANCAL